jgi:hypothetical protein
LIQQIYYFCDPAYIIVEINAGLFMLTRFCNISMKKPLYLIFFLIFSGVSFLHGQRPYPVVAQDILERQILYNGRVWRNLYSKIEGNPFLFSEEFLPGSVTINGKTFENMMLRYDIYKDQILILTDKIIILQLNKEMVDGFTVKYAEVTYNFRKLEEDDQSPVSGYVNVVYDKAASLYVKYRKEIDTSGSDNLYGIFYQLRRIYVRKDGAIHQISSRIEFLKLLADKKVQVRNYMKENKIKISKMNPWSFATILTYYDTLN